MGLSEGAPEFKKKLDLAKEKVQKILPRKNSQAPQAVAEQAEEARQAERELAQDLETLADSEDSYIFDQAGDVLLRWLSLFGDSLEGFFERIEEWLSPDDSSLPEPDLAKTPEKMSSSSKESTPRFRPSSKEKLKVTSRIQEVFRENPDWRIYLQEACSNDVPQEMVLGHMFHESKLKKTAKNPASSASGLAQFIDGTWAAFIKENPRFAGRTQFDPEASFHASAWYLRKISQKCGIDLHNPNEAWKVYIAYHEGIGGYRVFMRGGPDTVPKPYQKKCDNDPAKYRALIEKMAKSVYRLTVAAREAL